MNEFEYVLRLIGQMGTQIIDLQAKIAELEAKVIQQMPVEGATKVGEK